MKLKNLFLLFLIVLYVDSVSQTSDQAENLLNLASKQMESYNNIEFEFSYVLNNRIEQINQESSGQVTVAGEKYKLDFLDAIQLFDGKSLYTIVPENEEITITKAHEVEDFGINPRELLQFYKNGYDYHWDISQRVKGKIIQFIKLIPVKGDGETESLLVGIDTKQNHIYKIIEIGYNGTTTTLTINNMNVNSFYRRISSFLKKQIIPIISLIANVLKILDRYIIGQYLIRLLSVFAICMLIFVVQTFWLYIDDLAGKGLDFETIFKFLGYFTPKLIPIVLPLSILFASLMTFGSLAENYEFAAMKSTGISLIRCMIGLFLVHIFIGIGSFYFSNHLIPYGEVKSYNLEKLGQVKTCYCDKRGFSTTLDK